ncbi:hypothetical protein ABZY09_24950 [Streptomyces sp. NPDC002928]|uniref:hypothetical protein n=1 Tax=Streptomyces sp. NPDC002928 TaxID=3154440 RepID=UPI0033A54813
MDTTQCLVILFVEPEASVIVEFDMDLSSEQMNGGAVLDVTVPRRAGEAAEVLRRSLHGHTPELRVEHLVGEVGAVNVDDVLDQPVDDGLRIVRHVGSSPRT